jgi:DNA mismatch repair protein MutL
MGIIHKLDPHLVNQIAAGEVVERPASVVKELLENAIDAQATRIDIAVEEGGRKLIRVQDDGVGMEADDLLLAVASHATSKLSASEDLDRIGTLGFRGEALASIASVSVMTVTTCRPGAVGGHSLTVEGGAVGEVRAAGSAPGTTIEARNLFYNVPARRKFLKTDSTELGHIVEAVARVALAYPQVAIRLTHNGRTVHDLPRAEDARDRVTAFFGRHLAESLIEIAADTPVGRLWGLVAPPQESRASTKMQYLFINGRFVRDRSLLHAVGEAYRGLVEVNRQPVVFLYLTVPPEDIDVNVHPTKIEVRLRNGQQLYREVLAGLRHRFLTTDLTPQMSTGFSAGNADRPGPLDADAAEREQRIRQSMADFLRLQPARSQERFQFSPGQRSSAPAAGAMPGSFRAADRPAALPSRPPLPPNDDAQGDVAAPPMPSQAIQLHNTYLVAETGDGILIVDQHALHERVLYEELRHRVNAGPLESQRLLIPAVVDVTARERAFLEQHREPLVRLGVEIELLGPQAVGVQAFPMMLEGRAAPERVLRDLLDWAAEHDGSPAVEDLLDELLHRMACRAAVKAGETLSPEEIRDLLAQRDAVEGTATCPHGRPTSLMLTRSEIERQFKRDYRSVRPEEDETIPPEH